MAFLWGAIGINEIILQNLIKFHMFCCDVLGISNVFWGFFYVEVNTINCQKNAKEIDSCFFCTLMSVPAATSN